MSLEIETKIKVESHDALRAKLNELGAVKLSKVKETNQLFDDENKSMRGAGKGLRVRHVEHLEGAAVPASLTFKGPIMPAQFKTRPEIEVQINDVECAVRFLQALGYEPFITFEKIRESWQLGPCKVELDEVPHLGKFVEIEGQDQDSVNQAKVSLGLGSATHIAKSYVSMLMIFCRTARIYSKVVRF